MLIFFCLLEKPLDEVYHTNKGTSRRVEEHTKNLQNEHLLLIKIDQCVAVTLIYTYQYPNYLSKEVHKKSLKIPKGYQNQ